MNKIKFKIVNNALAVDFNDRTILSNIEIPDAFITLTIPELKEKLKEYENEFNILYNNDNISEKDIVKFIIDKYNEDLKIEHPNVDDYSSNPWDDSFVSVDRIIKEKDIYWVQNLKGNNIVETKSIEELIEDWVDEESAENIGEKYFEIIKLVKKEVDVGNTKLKVPERGIYHAVEMVPEETYVSDNKQFVKLKPILSNTYVICDADIKQIKSEKSKYFEI